MRWRYRKLALWLYVGAVMAAAAVALSWGLVLHDQVVDVWLLVGFVGLATVLELMVVPLAGGGGAAASFAAYFAGLLVLGPVVTAWVAVLVGLFADGVVRRARLVRACFNACHAGLSLLASGLLYQKLGGVVHGLVLGDQWPAVVAAGVCLWATETCWIAIAVVLDRGGKVVSWLRSSLAPMLALDSGMASVGLLLALLYQSRTELAGAAGWQGTGVLAVIAVVPSALLYYAHRLRGRVHEAYARSLRALGALVEAKTEAAQPGHSGRVADLAAALASALEVRPNQVEQVRYAGYLHDIGKVGMPALLPAGHRDPFTGESQPLRLHPEIGERILVPVRFLAPAAQMVRSHHERWDGLGYPDGLRGEQIALGARLLSIADAYVGMTDALSSAEALSQLRQAAGSRFDPGAVSVLAAVCSEARSASKAGAGFAHTAPASASGAPSRGLAWWR